MVANGTEFGRLLTVGPSTAGGLLSSCKDGLGVASNDDGNNAAGLEFASSDGCIVSIVAGPFVKGVGPLDPLGPSFRIGCPDVTDGVSNNTGALDTSRLGNGCSVPAKRLGVSVCCPALG